MQPLACHVGEALLILGTSGPCPRKAYPSFIRELPALGRLDNSDLRGPQEGLLDQSRLLRALSTLGSLTVHGGVGSYC